jgi:DNA-binding IclR family transcriptional regulator
VKLDATSDLANKPMHVVVRALSVLTCLADYRHGLTLQQLHQKLDIPLGSMHRILATLEHEKFVSRSDVTKRYVLGPSSTNLAQSTTYDSFVVAPPLPLVDAAQASGETVFLTQLIDSSVVCVALVEARHRLRLFVRVGQEMPLHAAASARIILAFLDPVRVETLLSSYPRREFTKATPREVNQLIDHFVEVRERGYDVCSSELDDDVWAVAAPVFDVSGRVNSGVTLAAAWPRMRDPRRRAQATLTVMGAADALSRAQGFTGQRMPPSTFDALVSQYETSPFGNLADPRSRTQVTGDLV